MDLMSMRNHSMRKKNKVDFSFFYYIPYNWTKNNPFHSSILKPGNETKFNSFKVNNINYLFWTGSDSYSSSSGSDSGSDSEDDRRKSKKATKNGKL